MKRTKRRGAIPDDVLMDAACEAVINAVMSDVRTAVTSRDPKAATEAAERVLQWAKDMVKLEGKG